MSPKISNAVAFSFCTCSSSLFRPRGTELMFRLGKRIRSFIAVFWLPFVAFGLGCRRRLLLFGFASSLHWLNCGTPLFVVDVVVAANRHADEFLIVLGNRRASVSLTSSSLLSRWLAALVCSLRPSTRLDNLSTRSLWEAMFRRYLR